jgi:predicted nucleotide-binding protein
VTSVPVERNPYNCSLEGNLFVGYSEPLRQTILGLENGKSYAVLGGRRCGKSSLLLEVAKKLLETAPSATRVSPSRSIRLLPRTLNIHAVVPRTPADFFGAIYRVVTDGLTVQPWSGSRYQDFLTRLDEIAPVIKQAHGPEWAIVLLIDELDAAVATLPDSECFQNLRNLLMASEYSRHFRMVASGITSLSSLILDRSSPLNNLDPFYLGILGVEEAHELMRAGFPLGLPVGVEDRLFELTGRHPYIIQGLLEYGGTTDPSAESLAISARRFVRDRAGTFTGWLGQFGEAGRVVYRELTKSAISAKELRSKLPRALSVQDGLLALSYHGVIDESDLDQPKISGTIFRDWFLENHNIEEYTRATETSASVRSVDSGRKRVFVVYGRNERMRVAMFTLLRALGLEPLEWTDVVEATGRPCPHINEILRAGFKLAHAAVVLFTPDEDARLKPEFRRASDLPSETELGPQPRPNVLFEAGMAMAYFEDRAVLVQVGPSRPFSDIAGIHYVGMDNNLVSRRAFAGRLRLAGCPTIDLNLSTEWQTAGDFSL